VSDKSLGGSPSPPFKSTFAENIYQQKYGHCGSWQALAAQVVDDVCGSFQGKAEPILSLDERQLLTKYIAEMKFIPGGRYLYYAGRPLHFWNNCFLLRGEEDTREEWGNLLKRSSDCLMSGGGIGADYSVFRPQGTLLNRTGGEASGPIPLMLSVNEHGRNVKQGGSRRSAIYASLNWQHGDAPEFLTLKDWHEIPIGRSRKPNGQPYTLADAKVEDFNFPAPLDMTNISLNYDDAWLQNQMNETFLKNVYQALKTGEPGFSFNFGDKRNETLRNACSELTSADDSDVCNLGSVNFANIGSLDELTDVVFLAARFLVCGTLRADLPYQKIYEVRARNRRVGLGLMGLHEWLLKRGQQYEVVPELHKWLKEWRDVSEIGAVQLCTELGISEPAAFRAIAPTGTIGIMASTTTGIEPLYAVAYKRRYLSDGTHWKAEYVVDATAELLVKEYGLDPDEIETASSLAADPERRIKFQADVQDYVDHAISSTINLPAWGTDLNNEDKVKPFAQMLAKYAPRLRGFTCYPDGSRGGQPITAVPYADAVKHKGVVFKDNDPCRDGVCSL
jgi:ribonucleoside-diphosphate reductase alpha chain